MNSEIAALIVVGLLLALAAAEVPIGLALAIAGSGGLLLTNQIPQIEAIVAATPYASSSKYPLFVIPMFLLMGALLARTGVSREIFDCARLVFGRVRGGVAATTVVATTIFSGISGSSVADVATMGRVSITEMRRSGYPTEYAAGIVAAAGAFAVLIPPNIGMVVYGLVSGESIGKLLLAGIIPGGISAFALVTYVVIRGVPKVLTTSGSGEHQIEVQAGDGADDELAHGVGIVASLRGGLFAFLIFGVMGGGLYTGVFTATEAGAVGAMLALTLAVFVGRIQRLPKLLRAAIGETVETTSMVFLLLLGGAFLTYFIVSANISPAIAAWIGQQGGPPLIVAAVLLLLLVALGMFLDGLSCILLTIPIMAPIIGDLGLDGIWFGILALKAVEIGLITPPVGLNCYVIAGLFPQVRVERIFRAVAPLVVLDLIVTAIFFAFPDIILWLPSRANF